MISTINQGMGVEGGDFHDTNVRGLKSPDQNLTHSMSNLEYAVISTIAPNLSSYDHTGPSLFHL